MPRERKSKPVFDRVTDLQIKGYLEAFVDNTVEKYKGRRIPTSAPSEYLNQASLSGQLKPFHAAIIPPELMHINEFERGFSTSLGTTFEESARIIAAAHYQEAHRGYDVSGQVSTAALNEIDRQVAQFEHAVEQNKRRPPLDKMISVVLAARRKLTQPLRVRADLFLLAHDGTEFYFEIKSPQPNKGQCLEVTQRLLRIHLLRADMSPRAQTFFAMAYNPYGRTRDTYRWSFARNYLLFDEIVLLGQEFWTIVGGGDVSTDEKLLSLYQEVGRQKTKFILDSLAFDL